MENTLENKAKFFAFYLGQNVYRYTPLHLLEVTHNILAEINSDCILELKTVSSITKEDLIELAKLVGIRQEEFYLDMGQIIIDLILSGSRLGAVSFDELLKIVDYLRSKGYALPFLGLSVASQISYGWVKLAEVW